MKSLIFALVLGFAGANAGADEIHDRQPIFVPMPGPGSSGPVDPSRNILAPNPCVPMQPGPIDFPEIPGDNSNLVAPPPVTPKPIPPSTNPPVVPQMKSGDGTAAVLAQLGVSDSEKQDIERLLASVNGERKRQGLPEFRLNLELSKAIIAHRDDQIKMNKLTHQGSDRSWPWDRAKRAGYAVKQGPSIRDNFYNVSEDGMQGDCTPSGFIAKVNYPKGEGHREDFLDAGFIDVGIAPQKPGAAPFCGMLYGRGT
jgi:uncharacterized protein YkwD